MKQFCYAFAFGVLAMLFASSCMAGFVSDDFDWNDSEMEEETSTNTGKALPPPSPQPLEESLTGQEPTGRDEESCQISEPVECYVCRGSGMAARPDDYSAYPTLVECSACKGVGIVWVASAEATRRALQSIEDYVNGRPSGLGNRTSSSFSSPSSNVPRKMRVCPSCDGKGYDLDRIIEAPNYTTTPSENWCAECQRWGRSHTHNRQRCLTCGGRKEVVDPYTR